MRINFKNSELIKNCYSIKIMLYNCYFGVVNLLYISPSTNRYVPNVRDDDTSSIVALIV